MYLKIAQNIFFFRILSGNLIMQKAKGLDTSKPHCPIAQEHLLQIYKNYFEDHYDNDPRCLQHKIYFDLAYYTGKGGTEGLRALNKNSFAININSEGREYLKLKYNEHTKKSDGTDNNEMRENNILLAQPGSRFFPVQSFKLYVSKLTKIDALFQQPNPYYKRPTDYWYKAQPVGEGTIGKFLAEILRAAGLSFVYTNHCIRGTTATGMKKNGHTLEEIAHVLKHKNLESLEHYLDAPTMKDRENYSKCLFKYTNPDQQNLYQFKRKNLKQKK